MTQEEKASAYDEAIKRAKEWEGNSAAVEYIFPELAESGDEKVRKILIEFVEDTTEKFFLEVYNINRKDVLAWLEKQSEQKSEWSVEDNLILQSIIQHYASKYEETGFASIKEKLTWLKSLRPQPSQEEAYMAKKELFEKAWRFFETRINSYSFKIDKWNPAPLPLTRENFFRYMEDEL